jgi:hypothetical protein
MPRFRPTIPVIMSHCFASARFLRFFHQSRLKVTTILKLTLLSSELPSFSL